MPMPMSEKYFAFISYSSEQGDWVARLQQNLERCLDHYARKVDPGAPRRVFLDQVDLRSGRSWMDQLQEAVEQSDRLILVMSPEAVASDWVRLEWQSFLSTRPKDLFPVRLAAATLPAFLRTIQWLDFSDAEGSEYRQRLTELFGDLLGRSRRDPPPMPQELVLHSPLYSSDAARDLAQALEVAYRQRAETLAEGGDVAPLNETIVDLKRQLRSGPQLEAGDFLLDGRFHLSEKIGKGGFATVWKAYDRQRHCLVAVKVLHSQYSDDKRRRDRFFRGARQMAELRHPGIVEVVEAECDDGGYHFFVMEYVTGGDFRQAVLAGRLTVAERLQAVLQVGEALSFAHGRGVIHRDVKPANILLAMDGRAKLTDFDLVRAADTTGGTRTGMMGTMLFAAPEAMFDGKEAAEPADVYGLGMTAVFALYGADLPRDAHYGLESFLSRLEVPPPVLSVLGKALARETSRRWSSMTDFCAALQRALEAMDGKIVGIPVVTPAQVAASVVMASQTAVGRKKPRAETRVAAVHPRADSAKARLRRPGRVWVSLGVSAVFLLALILFVQDKGGLHQPLSEPASVDGQSPMGSENEGELEVGPPAVEDPAPADLDAEAPTPLKEGGEPETAPERVESPSNATSRQETQSLVAEDKVGKKSETTPPKSSPVVDSASTPGDKAESPDEVTPKTGSAELPSHCAAASKLTGIELVPVPGGEYTLGAEDLDDDSKPVHQVKLSPFWIGKHPVTHAQYRRFVEAIGHRQPASWNAERFNGAQQPVVGVSWTDAQAYVEWAGFELPSEAQWEAAARGTDERRYPWGDAAPTQELADFGKDYGSDGPDGVGRHPRGKGPFDAEDQAGGVWEWCRDAWDENAYQGRDGRLDPVVEASSESEATRRVLRGGSWAIVARGLPGAIRSGSGAGDRYQDIGFRVVCGSVPEP